MYIKKILVLALNLMIFTGSAHANSKNVPCTDSIQLEETVVEYFNCKQKDRRFGSPVVLSNCQAKISNKYTHQCSDDNIFRLTTKCTGIIETAGKDKKNKKITRTSRETITSFVTLDSRKPGPLYLGYTFIEFNFDSEQTIHTADLLDALCVITNKELF